MPSKVAGILLLLATVPAWAQGSGDSLSPSASPRQHGPMRRIGSTPDRTIGDVRIFKSNNWSGYAVVGKEFTQAQGSWTVPTVDCSVTPNASASFWVGIDGWSDDTVEQTGTDSDCAGKITHYYAWYEFVPRGGVTIKSVPVSPGDQMSAEIDYNGHEEFTVTITNQTTSQSFSKTEKLRGAKRNSAEWIAELNGYNLADFGVVPFGQDFTYVPGTNSATDASTSGAIGAFGNKVEGAIMVYKKQDEAVPSSISADGTSFTVTWESK